MSKIIKPIKTICGIAFCLFLFGCEQKAIRTDATDNPAVSIDLLLQHDGCKVYRFTDNGHNHYFVKCVDTKTATSESTLQEGKTSRVETIVTVNSK